MQLKSSVFLTFLAAFFHILSPGEGVAQAGGVSSAGGERPAYLDLSEGDKERFKKLVEDLNRLEPESISIFALCFGLGGYGGGGLSKLDEPSELFDPNDINETPDISVPVDSKWRTIQTGTPLTGDSYGSIDSWNTYYAIRDPFFNTPFPLDGVGFGVTIRTVGDVGESTEDLSRTTLLTLVYEPLGFMLWRDMPGQ
jgi:hypothetical protein